MHDDASPTARALLALELISNRPGVGAEALATELGVSGRAARRYVAILREAGVPVESSRGPYGGYRIGRGHRLPPLMFTGAEALALVMAVLEARQGAADPSGPEGSALAKILRVLPEPVATPAAAVIRGSVRRSTRGDAAPDPQVAAALVQAGADARRVRLAYRTNPERPERLMDVDPWGVVVRSAKWYLLGWSHTAGERRVLRVDRVARVDVLAESFTPPPDLDLTDALEEHLAEGWTHRIEVVIEAPLADVRCWVPRNMGRLEVIDEHRTRLISSTDELDWFADRLASVRADFDVVDPPELRQAVADLARRLHRAARRP